MFCPVKPGAAALLDKLKAEEAKRLRKERVAGSLLRSKLRPLAVKKAGADFFINRNAPEEAPVYSDSEVPQSPAVLSDFDSFSNPNSSLNSNLS